MTALGAAWLMLAILAGSTGGSALAQGLSDVRLGNEAFRQGDYAAAVGHYTDAIRSGELVGEALAITYNNRGVAHGEAGDFDPAIADYSQALALRPSDPTTIRNLRVAHVRRGEVRFASGGYDDAVADFTTAIELEPGHHLAYQRRGELYTELGLLDLAVADLERAAVLSPGDPEIVAALERATQQVEENAAALEAPAATAPSASVPSSAPAFAEAEAAAPEAPGTQAGVADAQEPAPDEVADTAAAAPAAAAEPSTEQPVVAARPAPAARPAEAAAVEPEPVAAPPAAEPANRVAVAPTPAPEPAAGGATTAAAEGEPYRVISAVNFRAGPDNDAQRLGTVDAGRIVRVTGDTLGWKHVIVPSGERGFIYRSWLEPVSD
jgi:tetratricopeptide (TPR) repeat protein